MPFDETRFAVFSAHAEVVPMFIIIPREEGRILRARGGSSKWCADRRGRVGYSPRTRR